MREGILFIVALLWTAPAFAQVAGPQTPPPARPTLAQIGLVVYPADQQTPEQQAVDEDACFEWAEAQTGITMQLGSVDSLAAAQGAAAARGAGQGEVVGGAARGAVGGALIGAVAGDTGKGAAIGAVAGSLGGLRGRAMAQERAGRAAAQEVVQANQEAVNQFKKAASVCLEGRGYTVR